jgi:hypothetical protein
VSAVAPRRRRRSAGTSTAAQHAEWLGLIDVSGPFVSLGVLIEAFPQGLDADDPEVAKRLRAALDEWFANRELRRPDPGIHRAFIRFVLGDVLGYPDELVLEGPAVSETIRAHPPEARAPIRPDFAVGRSGQQPTLLVGAYGAGVALDRQLPERGFHASPHERMRQLLLASGVRSGLVTNGEKWTLVHAPGDRTATFATWDANDLLDERLTLRAFRSLLGVQRLFGVADEDTLDGLLERSRDDEREVTDRLGIQTRRAVELLVAALDRADRETGGRVVESVRELERNEEAERTLYEAAVVVAMRVVFLLAAESRGLLPSDGEWQEAYAVSPLRSELEALRDRSGEALLDHRYDAWPRLLASFRAVHGGVVHDRVRLPGYGGGLFDPARYPFLEVAAGRPHGISNRVVLRVLESLQTLEVEVPGGGRERRPLSDRALGVEQIGHVYERLLDHIAMRADEPAVGLLGSAKKEPEVGLDVLDEEWRKGVDEFLDFLKETTGRNLRSRLLGPVKPERIDALAVACGRDEELIERVLPYLPIVRDDAYGLPTVFAAGSVYVTESPERRATGTHYTPPSLTEPIVKHALDPLVYEGPAEGKPEPEWQLRRPEELLALKVCDIAMGSGAFLVAAARYLGARLVEAWDDHPEESPDDLPAELEERGLVARRLVAERCLYGVDKNPLAVEIAKVSLWLETLRKDRPFTFVDHALRTGDSLIGITDLRQLEELSLQPTNRPTLLGEPAREAVRRGVAEARALRERIEATDAVDLRDVAEKEALLRDAERATARLRQVADLICGVAIRTAGSRDRDAARELIEADANAILALLSGDEDDGMVERAAMEHLMHGCAPSDPEPPQPFHWALDFPEVFDSPLNGFDAIVGNPPFLGGSKISGTLGPRYRATLSSHLARGRGNADLVAYFFVRANDLMRRNATFGLVATNTIAEGDTHEVALGPLCAADIAIYRAIVSAAWPGNAALHVSHVWALKGKWSGRCLLADAPVGRITSTLHTGSRVSGHPHSLANNRDTAFEGSKLLGRFELDPSEAETLVTRDARSREVVMPFLNAKDLVTRPDHTPSRYVINFRDLSAEEAARYSDCWVLVQERVRPHREQSNDAKMREYWWRFERWRPALYEAIAVNDRVLVGPGVAKYWSVAFVENGWVYANTLDVFVLTSWGAAAVLSSTFHDAWARKWSSSLDTRLRYSPTDCFETYPLPVSLDGIDATGAAYLDHRKQTMLDQWQGLTRIYNRVHEHPEDSDPAIERLRELRVKLDRAVADAYGWVDLELDHDFRETPLGLRFTLSDAVRTEVLDRLLELNHERYAEEVAQGLHDKRGRGRR